MKIRYRSKNNSALKTKEDLIRDFIMVYLSKVPEVEGPVCHFFDGSIMSEFSDAQFDIDKNYLVFIEKEHQIDWLKNPQQNVENLNINEISDLLDDDEIISLAEYLNNYNYGEYYEEYYGNLNTEDIHQHCRSYLRYRAINNGIFISYLLFKIGYILHYYIESDLKDLVLEIDKLYNTKTFVGVSFESEYTQTIKSKYFNNYFQNLESTFQFYGFFDEKGLFVDTDLTLTNALRFYLNNEIDYYNNQDTLKLEISRMMSYLQIRYFYFKFFGKEPDDLFDEHKEHLKEEFDKFKSTNSKLVNFLSEKSYDSQEIDIILNMVSNNRYSELDIRYITLDQVSLFRILWLFGIFEYFTVVEIHQFKSSKDFDVLLKLNSQNNYKKYSQQFKKYYDFIQEKNFKDNPFNIEQTENLIQKIGTTLEIDREKLNAYTK